jgi:hypothetical protein
MPGRRFGWLKLLCGCPVDFLALRALARRETRTVREDRARKAVAFGSTNDILSSRAPGRGTTCAKRPKLFGSPRAEKFGRGCHIEIPCESVCKFLRIRDGIISCDPDCLFDLTKPPDKECVEPAEGRTIGRTVASVRALESAATGRWKLRDLSPQRHDDTKFRFKNG